MSRRPSTDGSPLRQPGRVRGAIGAARSVAEDFCDIIECHAFWRIPVLSRPDSGSSEPVLEAPALVAGLDDVAVMGEPIEERCGHLGVAEDGRPLAEGEVRGDDDGALLVEPADQVEEQLAAGLCEGQIAEFVEDDEVHAGEIVGHAALAAGAGFGLELVDEIDDVEEAAASAGADAGPGDRDGEMGLAGPGAAARLLRPVGRPGLSLSPALDPPRVPQPQGRRRAPGDRDGRAGPGRRPRRRAADAALPADGGRDPRVSVIVRKELMPLSALGGRLAEWIP